MVLVGGGDRSDAPEIVVGWLVQHIFTLQRNIDGNVVESLNS
jgi:hypothetical protein